MTRRSMSSIGAAAATRGAATWSALRGSVPESEPVLVQVDRPAGWWDLLPFTVHRIPLGGGLETATIDGVDPFDDVRTDLVVDACGGSLDGRTVVDLGCLEGGFTLAFAERGAAHVVGIEARSLSVERCELARALRGAERVEFVVADIKDELLRRDPFDVVFAAGILYHVGDPAELLRIIRASCREVALIDTHVAHPTIPTHGCSELVDLVSGGHSYRGRRFQEYEPDASASARDGYLWAAWSDSQAFWPLEEELVKMITDAGFSSVEKVDMDVDDRRSRWQVDEINRVVYVVRP